MTADNKAFKLRMWAVYAVLVLFALGIVVRLFTIQVVEGEKWKERAEVVTTKYRTVIPDRGNIYSSNSTLLATTLPMYDLHMDMQADGLTDDVFSANIDLLCSALADYFQDKSAQDYRRELIDARLRGKRYHEIKRNVTFHQQKEVATFPLFNLGRFKSGYIATKRMERKYRLNGAAGRTIGGKQNDSTWFGIEGGYDGILRGVEGKRLERRLTGDVWMPVDDGDGTDPLPGGEVYTTLDMNLQDVADAALRKQIIATRADHGCVVVMETATGRIRAISNLTRTGDSTCTETKRNWAVWEAVDPGSTIKLASLIVAMEDGLLTPEDTVHTHKGVRYWHRKRMEDSHPNYDILTIRRAFELSSNVGIAGAIWRRYKNDPQKFVDGLKRLRLDQQVGVAIPGEGVPKILDPKSKDWDGLSLPWMAHGYSLSETPLQMLTFYNAVANKGRMMQPQFVERIVANGKTKTIAPVVLKEKICSDATLAQARSLLEGVVDTGTATNLKSSYLRIAGKTGTAQINDAVDGYKGGRVKSHRASFIGYFPAQAPIYTCLVMVSQPRSGIYTGNWVAGPIFRSIADKVYANRLELEHPAPAQRLARLQPHAPITIGGHSGDLHAALEGLGIAHNMPGESEWVRTEAGDSTITVREQTVPQRNLGLVPNVVGMGLRDALFILENHGLHVNVVGSGMVSQQSLKANTRYVRGNSITIKLT
ncbi:MAG: penicillin-binding protein [Flavobacteriales bacterium]